MTERARVLFCDDDPINRQIVRELLQDDYEIEEAENGEACLALCAAFQPDVMLLDIMMPGIDGHTTCRQIVTESNGRSPQIICVSARTSTAERLRSYESGADDYIVKPFDHDELRAKVQVHIRLRRAIVEMERMNKELRAHHDELDRLVQVRTEEVSRSKDAAEAANRAKSDFLANMSHEIRTPMTLILGYTEIIMEQGDLTKAPPQRIEAAKTIKRNGEYLLRIFNDILDLSKIEAGKMTVERKECQPCLVVAEVVSLMRVRADAKGLPLNIQYDGAIPETIPSDPTRLRQILINLIGNAIKFTEVGEVRLITRFVDDGDAPVLQFDVIDTGRGMTEKQVAALFQPFMQADTSTTRKFGGTGLGLTISKRFAELLGGDITVAATEVGVGTTFHVTVTAERLDGVKMLDDPMSVTVVKPIEGDPARAAPSSLQGVRILFAEDGPDNQRLISFILSKAGADVETTDNGKLALDAVLRAKQEDKPFDVILMDMQMPVMDGYEATRQLRQTGHTGPIIALTAHAMAGDRQKCLDAGCDDYATKPIDRARLIEVLERNVRQVAEAV